MNPGTAATAPVPAPSPASMAATTHDPSIDALLQRAGQIHTLPVGEHNGHYGQLLGELTAELDASPGAAAAPDLTSQEQP